MKKILFLLPLFFILQACEQYCDCEQCEDCEPLDCNILYTGLWHAESNCSPITINNYTLTINESTDCIETTVYNFLGEGEIITIRFGAHSIIIPEQSFDRDDNIYGTGFLYGDTLQINFTLKDKTFDWEDLCELIAIKKHK